MSNPKIECNIPLCVSVTRYFKDILFSLTKNWIILTAGWYIRNFRIKPKIGRKGPIQVFIIFLVSPFNPLTFLWKIAASGLSASGANDPIPMPIIAKMNKPVLVPSNKKGIKMALTVNKDNMMWSFPSISQTHSESFQTPHSCAVLCCFFLLFCWL